MKTRNTGPSSGIRYFVGAVILILLPGCAHMGLRPSGPPLDNAAIAYILESIQKQDKRVHTLFFSGRMTLRDGENESEADVLVIGKKDPFTVKVEITHSWGRPLLHILVEGSKLQILSFSDKRLYYGRVADLGASGFLPVRLEPDQLWTLVRCYPILRKYHRAISMKGDQISLFDDQENPIQVIDLDAETKLPLAIEMPEEDFKAEFANLEDVEGLIFAKHITVESPHEKALMLKVRRFVFNKPIPGEILTLQTPLGFDMAPLRGTGTR